MQERTYDFPQFIELPRSHYYMARTKLEDPNGNALKFSLFQAKSLVQKLNEQLFGTGMIYIATSDQWTGIHKELGETAEGISLMANNREGLDSGLEEIVDSLLAYPNPEIGNYSPRVNPPLPLSTYPYLIEGATIDFDIGKVGLVINGGQRTPLKNFPQTSGLLSRHIPELGLFEGTMLYVNPDYRHEEGLRVIARGGYHVQLEKRGTGPEQVSACFLPSLPSPLLGLRVCSVTPVGGVNLERYTTILNEILVKHN